MDDFDVPTSYLPLLVDNLENLIISESTVGSNTAPDLQATRSPISSLLPSFIGDSISLDDPNLPEFIEHAYCFFVANIHNPYPTREEKQAIVDKSNSSRVSLISVSNWFINTRRRCGWAEILKRRCGGNREEMISVATRIFVEEDPDRPVDPQVVAEFMEMKGNVKSMQEKEARTTAWIENLSRCDSASSSNCRESSVKDQRQERQEKNIRIQIFPIADKVKRWRGDQKNQNDMEHAIPSPGSFFLSPSDAVDEDEPSPVPMSGKRKTFHEDSGSFRRNISPALSSFSSTSDSLDGRVPLLSWSDDDERPHKRSRHVSNFSTPITPSPRSRELLLEPFSFSPSSHLPAARGQKRSYTDFDPPPKPKRIRSSAVRIARDITHVSNLPDPLDITGRSGTETGNANIHAAVDIRGPPADNNDVETESDAFDSTLEQNEIDSQPVFPLLAAPLQFVPEQSPPPAPLSEISLPNLQINLSSSELTYLWPQNHPQISLTEPSDLLSDDDTLDLSGLMFSTHISTSIPLTRAGRDAVPSLTSSLNDLDVTIDLTGRDSVLGRKRFQT